MRRRIRWIAMGAVMAALALRILAAGFANPAPHNGAAYLLPSARALLGGESWLSPAMPPLYPALVAAFGWVGDLEWAGKLVSLAAGVLAVPLAFGIGRRLFGLRAGLWASWIAAICPGLIRYAGEAQEDMTHAALFTLALWLAIRTARRPRAIRAAATGAAAGLGYLVRPESTAVVALLAGGLAFEGWRRKRRGRPARVLRRVLLAALAGAAFLAVASPYILWVHGRYGIWTLSPKARILADYGDATEVGLQRISRQDPSRTVHEYRMTSPRALAERSRVARARARPLVFLRAFAGNLVQFVGRLPEVAGAGFVFAALLGLVFRRRRMRRPPGGAALAWTGAVVAVLVCGIAAFYVSRRFWLPALPILCGLFGAGAETLATPREGPPTARRRAAAAVLLAALVLPQTIHVLARDGLVWGTSPERRAGAYLAARVSPEEGIMSAKARVPFYADRPAVPIPDEGPEAILAFAARRGARYLAAEPDWLRRRHPSLWLDLASGRAGEAVAAFEGAGREVRIWRLRQHLRGR